MPLVEPNAKVLSYSDTEQELAIRLSDILSGKPLRKCTLGKPKKDCCWSA